MNTGIYAIRNTANGKAYVGSARHIPFRWKAHRHLLSRGKHHSPALQRAWVKHGEGVFVFEVLEQVSDPALLIEREQFWIDQLKAADPSLGYNVGPVAGSRAGVPQPPEVAEANRLRWLGKAKSEAHKAKIGAAHKGRAKTEEERRKTSEAVRRRLAENPEILLKMRQPKKSGTNSLKGRKLSEEHKAKLREAQAASVASNPDRLEHNRTVASMGGAAMKERGRTPEEREQIKAWWEANRETMREKMRTTWEKRRAKAAAEGKPVLKSRGPHSEETKARMRAAWARRKGLTD